MGVTAYKDKDGRWRYRFSRRGKRYSGSTLEGNNTKAAALLLERRHIEKLERNVFTGAMPTVSAFIDRFLEYQKSRVKPLTYEQQECHLKLHVQPTLGRMLLDEVGKKEIDELVTAWSRDAKPRTVNVRLGTLMRMFSLAVEWRIIAAPPDGDPVKVPKDTPRFLSWEEATRLLEAAKDRTRSDEGDWHSMILVGLRTGLRVGELRGLRWSDLNLSARGSVHVQRTDPGRPGLQAGSPKGGRGRVIPLTPDALACLRDYRDSQVAKLGELHPHPGLWVWPGVDDYRELNRTRAESSCKHAIDRIARRAGVNGVGWHTLRHTFASWLVIRGVPLRVVQELLGHASIKMTERYAHLAPGAVNHAVVASLDIPLVESPDVPALPSGDEEEPNDE